MKIRNDIVGAGFHARPREAERLPYRDYAIGEERFFVALRMTGLFLASPVSGEVAHEV